MNTVSTAAELSGDRHHLLNDIPSSLPKMASTALFASPYSGGVRSQILNAPFSFAAFSIFANGNAASGASSVNFGVNATLTNDR